MTALCPIRRPGPARLVGPQTAHTPEEEAFWDEAEAATRGFRLENPGLSEQESCYAASAVCQWLWDRCAGFDAGPDLHGGEMFWDYLVAMPYRDSYDDTAVATAVVRFLGFLTRVGTLDARVGKRLETEAREQVIAWLAMAQGRLPERELLRRIRICGRRARSA